MAMTRTSKKRTIGGCARALSLGWVALSACGTRTNVGELPDAGSSGGAAVGTGGGGGFGGAGGSSGSPGGGGAVGGGGGSGGAGGLGGGVGGRGCAIAHITGNPPPNPIFMDLRTFHAGRPRSMTLGDLNGDGKADMVVADDYGVNVLLNDTNSNFPKVASYLSDDGVRFDFIGLGDFDGDGKLDLAAVGNANPLVILLNDGNGGFVAPMQYAFSGGSFVLMDVNRDGRTDIVVDGSSVLLNTGDRSFTPGSLTRTFALGPSETAPSSSRTSIGDIDGDGRADIVTSTNALAVSLGTSSGTFASPMPFGPGVSGPIIIRDLNGDCLNDIVGYNSGRVSILLNGGGGKFAIGVDYAFTSPPFNAGYLGAVGDLNNDGAPDLAMETGSATETAGGLGVLLNDGRGGFPISVNLPTGQNVNSIAIADVNGDGKPDLAAAYESGVEVLLNVSP